VLAVARVRPREETRCHGRARRSDPVQHTHLAEAHAPFQLAGWTVVSVLLMYALPLIRA
jgi:hypothetical protein